MDYMKEGKGMLSDVMNRLENVTLEENRAALEKKMEEMKGACMQQTPPSAEKDQKGAIDTAKAEELCSTYFSKYHVQEFQCVGETTNHSYSAYNVQGFDEKGMMIFAEIDRNSGDLIRFDYYEECSAENFDMDNAERIAQEFLGSLGYENLTVARYKANGSTVDFTFVYEEDGVVYYPDTIHVKVCRSRGVISGMDAAQYIKNHKGRDALNVKVNMEAAVNKLSDKLSIEASRLAVVDTARGERAAYEFLCSYQEDDYYIFLDANTGEEIAIINVNNVR
jgi:spore germination protein